MVRFIARQHFDQRRVELELRRLPAPRQVDLSAELVHEIDQRWPLVLDCMPDPFLSSRFGESRSRNENDRLIRFQLEEPAGGVFQNRTG